MRGREDQQEEVFSYIPLEKRVPEKHPLRRIRAMTEEALRELSPWLDRLYAQSGRPSIPPEQLLRALILQALYTIRSEAQLMDQIDGNLYYRWFVGLKIDERVWDATVFSKNRERLMAGEVAQKFFAKVREQAERAGLLDDEHFSVDGSLIQAWASRDSYVEKKDPPQRGTGARGRKLLRDTHESRTDPDAQMYRKGAGLAQLSYLGHVVTEHKHGLIVESCLTKASKRAEWEAAVAMLTKVAPGHREITVAADRAYQEETFIAALRVLGVVPLVAEYKPSKHWKNWLNRGEREHPRFAVSQKKRRLIEKVFSWIKNIAGLRRTRLRGQRRVEWAFRIAATAHNLVRMAKLIPAM